MIWIRGVLTLLLILTWGRGTAFSQDDTQTPLETPIEITTEQVPSGYQGDEYSTRIRATGGRGVYYFLSGSIPSGLTLDGKGKLHGKLKAGPGSHAIPLIAVDPEQPDFYHEKTLTLTIHEPLGIPRQKIPPAMAGAEYHHQLLIQGGSETCRTTMTGLPPGLAIDHKGLISGIPENGPASQDLVLFFEETETPGHKVSRTFSLKIYAPLIIVNESFKTLRVGHALKETILTQGGSGKALFESDDLPKGLTMSPSGRVSGIPESGRGTHDLIVRVHDQILGATVEKHLALTLVDFFPDAYEALEGTEGQGKNIMKPGDPPQEHNFDRPGDMDTVFLDLGGLAQGDVIRVGTEHRSKTSRIRLVLEDPAGNSVQTVDDRGGDGYPGFLYVCTQPGMYRVMVTEDQGETGDYGLALTRLGPKIILATQDLPDQQTLGPVDLALSASHGSGTCVFTASGLPQGLEISSLGRIQGDLSAPEGTYPVTITVTDTLWGNIDDTKEYPLKVVDFFPDAHEQGPGDSDFTTGNTLVPGTPVQSHTFHTKEDVDVTKLDLSAMEKGHVLCVKTLPLTRETHTALSLFDSGQNPVPLDMAPGENTMSTVYVDCKDADALFLSIEEKRGMTGDYGLLVEDKGPRIRIKTQDIPDALSKGPFSFQINGEHGSGSYHFSGQDMPKGMTINDQGLIQGDLDLVPGQYAMTIHVSDSIYKGITARTHYNLKVVEFFPDDYEASGDEGFDSQTVMKPGDEIQWHTLNRTDDCDVIRLDLTGVQTGHVLDIRSSLWTKATGTHLWLYDQNQALLSTDSDRSDPKNPYSRLVVECPEPGVFFLKIRSREAQVGDYGILLKDGGPKVRLVDQDVPDVLTQSRMEFHVMAADGSGHYHFESKNLPPGLAMTSGGHITGDITLKAGVYPFDVSVQDMDYPGMAAQSSYALKVVDYFPDEFEAMNDQDELTTNTMKPGDPAQAHCFHEPGDVDVVLLDLGLVSPGDVIIIKTRFLTKETKTAIHLSDAMGKALGTDVTGGNATGATIVFPCATPGQYVLKILETLNHTGDYSLSVDNSGQPLSFVTENLNMAESVEPYAQPLEVKGGCGTYRFEISGGALPKGLKLDPDSGKITGQNTDWGHFTVTVTAMDSRFAENHSSGKFEMDAYIGRKLTGEYRFVFPHYVSGTFSLETDYTQTRAFPGNIRGGTKGNLRYRIVDHSIPDGRFTTEFDALTGVLSLKELSPVSCNQYENKAMDVEVEVRDSVYTNNTLVFHYEIPARCLAY
ncbi:MAG: Ig domain-containing protein [Proteobacteria bacterium]|nr:Ig domain-containing protein [Pseudomonadota bacterium]